MVRRRGLLPVHLVLLALCVAAPAFGQVDLVDPDAPAVKKEKPEPDESDTPEEPVNRVEKVDPGSKGLAPVKVDAGTKAPVGVAPVGGPKKGEGKKLIPDLPAPVARPAAAPLLVTRGTDADLEAAWEKWRTANASNNSKAEAAARAELLKAKAELGAADLEAFSQGMLRAAMAHEAASDSAGAIDLGLAAVELAPDVPSSWLGLSRVYFAVDPSGLPRTLDALKTAAVKLLGDPRYLRPVIADFANALLTALTALAVAVVLVLFLRRARYFFFDFHFLFPRVLARWQSTAVAVLILLLPIVFRMGVAPVLLALFAAVALYLTNAERLVATGLIAVLGVIPTLGTWVTRYTAFAGTRAETVYLIEQGANAVEPLAAQLAQAASQDKASFAELFALGRFELRRGKLDLAVPRLKAALQKKPGEPRASVNLGVAMLLTGDLENPKSLFEEAAKADPTLAEPLFDLARLYQRRGATLGVDTMAAELDRAHTVLNEARQRDPSIPDLKEAGPTDTLLANPFLRTLPLATEDLLALAEVPEVEDRIRGQLTSSLVGDVPEPVAPVFPAFAALLLFGLGFLARSVEAARPCTKCGAPVSRRSDPELSKGSQLCTQCVNVFARKGVVPPALKVRKQLEVSRYESRLERISYALGLACSGMGHIFSGLIVRGTIYGFLFLLVIVLFLQRHGVMRAPYIDPPMALRLVTLGIIFALVYLLPLRGLYKRQG